MTLSEAEDSGGATLRHKARVVQVTHPDPVKVRTEHISPA